MVKKYYAVTTTMTFEKTILVPVECARDIEDAIDMVECGVETASIDLLNNDADSKTIPSPYADKDGILKLTNEEKAPHQILTRDIYTLFTYKNLETDDDGDMSFTVPKEWAEEWCAHNGYASRKDFHINYTWDESLQMYMDAVEVGVILYTSEGNPELSEDDIFTIQCKKSVSDEDGEITISILTVECGSYAECYDFERFYPGEFSEEEIKKKWQRMKIKAAELSRKENYPLFIHN